MLFLYQLLAFDIVSIDCLTLIAPYSMSSTFCYWLQLLSEVSFKFRWLRASMCVNLPAQRMCTLVNLQKRVRGHCYITWHFPQTERDPVDMATFKREWMSLLGVWFTRFCLQTVKVDCAESQSPTFSHISEHWSVYFCLASHVPCLSTVHT
jgi:hypothetical protein